MGAFPFHASEIKNVVLYLEMAIKILCAGGWVHSKLNLDSLPQKSKGDAHVNRECHTTHCLKMIEILASVEETCKLSRCDLKHVCLLRIVE